MLERGPGTLRAVTPLHPAVEPFILRQGGTASTANTNASGKLKEVFSFSLLGFCRTEALTPLVRMRNGPSFFLLGELVGVVAAAAAGRDLTMDAVWV